MPNGRIGDDSERPVSLNQLTMWVARVQGDVTGLLEKTASLKSHQNDLFKHIERLDQKIDTTDSKAREDHRDIRRYVFGILVAILVTGGGAVLAYLFTVVTK